MIRAIREISKHRLTAATQDIKQLSAVALQQCEATSHTLLAYTTMYHENWQKLLNQAILKSYFVQAAENNCPISLAVSLSPVEIIYANPERASTDSDVTTDSERDVSKQVFDANILSRELFVQCPERFRISLHETINGLDASDAAKSEVDVIKTIIKFNKTLLKLIAEENKEKENPDVKPLTCPATRKEIADVRVVALPALIQNFWAVVDKNVQTNFEITAEDRKTVADFLDVFTESDLGNGDDVLVCAQTLLYIACKYGLTAQVNRLLELGADPNCAQSFASGSDRSITPLHVAAKFGYGSVIRLLLNNPYKNANPNLIPPDGDSEGNAALYSAAAAGHAGVVAELIKAKAFINQPSGRNLTPLYIAVFRNHISAVTKILELGESHNLDIDSLQGEHQSQQGRTALFCAAREGHAELVDLLLVHGADPTVQQGDGPDQGATALEIANDMQEFDPEAYNKIIASLEQYLSRSQDQKCKS